MSVELNSHQKSLCAAISVLMEKQKTVTNRRIAMDYQSEKLLGLTILIQTLFDDVMIEDLDAESPDYLGIAIEFGRIVKPHGLWFGDHEYSMLVDHASN